MKKEIAKEWMNVPFSTWQYQPQTEMKHKVIKYYLPIWAKILRQNNDTLNYIDGFGGIGAYHTIEDVDGNKYISNKYGSPIFSMETMSSLKKQGVIRCANAIIIDKSKENIDNIKIIANHVGIDHLNIEYIHGEFDAKINAILDKLEKMTPSPTFFLIDPFGFTIRLNTIRRIMKLQKTEVLINFMYNAISRHINNKNEKINIIYDELFGTKSWRDNVDKIGEDKELSLVNLFRIQCKQFSKFVYPFKLNFPEINRPYYYLFHLSNHYLGCKLMKEAFAANNQGDFEYKGTKAKQLNFINLLGDRHNIANFKKLCAKCFIVNKKRDCEQCIMQYVASKSMSFEEFIKRFVDTIPFTEKEIKNMILDFESKRYLSITSTRNRRTGLKNSDILNFI